MTTLTPEEAEFTYVNCLAFDIARRDAMTKNTHIPAWLCSSAEARLEMRQKSYDILNAQLRPPVPFTEASREHAEKFIKDRIPFTMVSMWKNAELALKQEREEGNPRAFFV